MAPPPAREDVSEHPAKNAVTAPKVVYQQTNKRIDSYLHHVYDNRPIDIDSLSPQGQRLINDTHHIASIARLIVQEKNVDELLQLFIWHAGDIEKETLRTGDVSEHFPANGENDRADNEQAVCHLRTLVKQRVQSGDGDLCPLDDVHARGQPRAQDFAGEGVKAGEEVDVCSAELPTREAQAKQLGLMGKTKDMMVRISFFFLGGKLIMEYQRYDDYQQSIRWLLDYIEPYAKHGLSAAGSGGGETARGIISVNDYRRGPGLQPQFKTVNDYVRRVLLESGFVLEPKCNAEGRELREPRRHFYDDKYRPHFDYLFNRVGAWFNATSKDPHFGKDWAQLTKDLVFDSEGSLKFKPELWNDVHRVILPQVIDQALNIPAAKLFNLLYLCQVRSIPIPHIEYTDKNLDLVVENLTLQGRPTVILRSTACDKSSVFQVGGVHIKVDSLKLSVCNSKHNFFWYKTVKPHAKGLAKRQIQKVIKDALTAGLEGMDGQLVVVRDRMESAKETEGRSRTDVLKNICLSANKKEEASIKRAEKPSQFKVVSNKRDSILTQAPPVGWVTLTEKREENAVHGHEWRSEAYVIFLAASAESMILIQGFSGYVGLTSVEPEHHRGNEQRVSPGIIWNGQAHQICSTAVTDVQGLPASVEARGMRLTASPTHAVKG
ncbi:hypothetical protein AN958_00365 [Leucoagaricus sp. SymC.cos]|nr:hypothetical protein AN958_00365 [Leucoagaricus sp. SymC.cos]